MKIYIVYVSGERRIIKGYFSSQKKAIARVEEIKENFRSCNDIFKVLPEVYYVERELDKPLSEFR